MRMSADERRQAVLAAAVHEFARAGFAGTSTEAIAARAGISQPYLFRLFASKRELFIAAVDRCFARVERRFAEVSEGLEGSEALEAMGEGYAELISDRDLLLLQLQAYAASADEGIAAFVRRRYVELVTVIADRTGLGPDELRPFFAMGMLCNVSTALGLFDVDELWGGLAWSEHAEGRPGACPLSEAASDAVREAAATTHHPQPQA